MNVSENDNGRPYEDRDNYDLDAGGVKFDAGKIRLDLVPPESELAQAAVYTYGAIKYDDWNWSKGMRKGRLVAALKRHTNAYLLGEELNDESGLPHTWHMHCCTGMLIGIELRGVAEEDRQTSLKALENVRQAFTFMKDPSGTVKNGGGTVVETDFDKLDRDAAAILGLDVDRDSTRPFGMPHKGDDKFGAGPLPDAAEILGLDIARDLTETAKFPKTGGLFPDEIAVLDAIDRMKELPFADAKRTAIVDYLRGNGFILPSNGRWILTKKGYNTLILTRKVREEEENSKKSPG